MVGFAWFEPIHLSASKPNGQVMGCWRAWVFMQFIEFTPPPPGGYEFLVHRMSLHAMSVF